jgi:plastocyanin
VSLVHVRQAAAACSFALAVGLLTACGNSDDSSAASTTSSTSSSSSPASSSSASSSSTSTSSAAPAAQTLSVTEADFSIDLDSTTLPAGDYTITVTNNGHATHDFVVEQNGSDVAKSDTLGPGASGTVTVTLQPGSYVFYCSIGNHRAMGMETNVTVS